MKKLVMFLMVFSIFVGEANAATPKSIVMIGASVDYQLFNCIGTPPSNCTSVPPSGGGYTYFMGWLPENFSITNFSAQGALGEPDQYSKPGDPMTLLQQANVITAANKPGFVIVGLTGQICWNENHVANATYQIMNYLQNVAQVERILVMKYPVVFEPYGHVDCEMTFPGVGSSYLQRATNYNNWLASVSGLFTHVTVINPFYLYNAIVEQGSSFNPPQPHDFKIHASTNTLVRAAQSLNATLIQLSQ